MKITEKHTLESKLHGKYLIFYTIHHSFWPKGKLGDYFPVGYFKITDDDVLPDKKELLESADFMKSLEYKNTKQCSYRCCINTTSKKRLSEFKYIV